MSIADLVALVDDDEKPFSSAPKATFHGADTPLHLVFSSYLLSRDGHILLTRPALSKPTWAGNRTHNFWGHPAPAEDLVAAVRRRTLQELNVDLNSIEVTLEDFRYRAVDPAGVVEHEICPVFTAKIYSDPVPNMNEINERNWVSPEVPTQSFAHAPFVYNPWLRAQLPLLLSAQALTDKTSHGNW